MSGFIDNDDIPQSVPMQMTTSGLSLFFSNLERDFGPNRPVNVEYSVVHLGNITIDGEDDEINALVDIKLAFWVQTEEGDQVKDLEFYIRDVSISFTIVIEKETNQLYGRVNQMEMGTIEIVGDPGVEEDTIK